MFLDKNLNNKNLQLFAISAFILIVVSLNFYMLNKVINSYSGQKNFEKSLKVLKI